MKPYCCLRRSLLPLLLATTAVLALTTVGCGNSTPVIHLDDAVAMTEDTLTEALLGPNHVSETDPTPRDKPLLRRGVYETVLIAADEKAFSKISRGALKDESIRDVEDRVTKTVEKRISRRGFTAKRVDYPVSAADIAANDKVLLATLMPVTEDAGSPIDHAEGKARKLILVRLTIADPRSGNILMVRDYYSGSDVPRDKDGHFRLRYRDVPH